VLDLNECEEAMMCPMTQQIGISQRYRYGDKMRQKLGNQSEEADIQQ